MNKIAHNNHHQYHHHYYTIVPQPLNVKPGPQRWQKEESSGTDGAQF